MCSHHVSGVADNPAQMRGRESLPSQTLMSRLISCRHRTKRTREEEQAAFVLAGGLSHYMQQLRQERLCEIQTHHSWMVFHTSVMVFQSLILLMNAMT